ncbi:hypothetical protein [Brucella sp.]|uniref:hypothetical protein n=1 Tax=Brucella sp. TaxID=52132 RepID=UPI0039195609
MRTPSFFLLDAHCIFVLPRFLFCIRSWTFAVLLATVLSFAAIPMFPYRPASAVREFRSALAVLCASPLATTDCVLWWITALSIALRAKKRLFVADVRRVKLHAFAGFFRVRRAGRNKNYLARLFSQ